MSEEEYLEYDVFTDVTKDGDEVELAVVDRFVFKEKNYVAVARVIGDEISDEGLFVYRSTRIGEDIVYKKIEDPDEYAAAADYYANLE